MRQLIIYTLLVLFQFSTFQAPAQEVDTFPKKLVVGIKESPPFIYKDDAGQWTGLSIFLWEEIATSLDLTYEYQENDLAGLIEKLENDSIDLSINPLTVTSQRIEKIYFTQPFYVSNSAVVAPRASGLKSLLAGFLQFFSLEFFQAVLLLFLVIFVFGMVAWWFERKKNPEEFRSGWKGLWDGIWWSAVTMTTVGYGDKSPQSVGGRIIALIWMFTAIIIISSFTASITSSLTVNQLGSNITNVNDLKNFSVGTLEASATESYLRSNKIKPKAIRTIKEGLEQLTKGQVYAFVYDEPILRYYLNQGQLQDIQVLPFTFNSQYYSFGLPHGSPLRDVIDPVLVRIVENREWKIQLSLYDLHEM